MGFRELEEVWDALPAVKACALAWQDPGPRRKVGTWHPRAREEVAHLMPLLARALDRLLVELADELPDRHSLLWD